MQTTITSDIVIEIINQAPYRTNTDNVQQGKEIRPMMEELGWTYNGEINKTVHGQNTTVAQYEREE